MNSYAVNQLRAALSGTGWAERAASLGCRLRTANHTPGGLLLVGTPTDEPWHLAAHLDEEARRAHLPHLRPTLIRWSPPPEAPPHLAVGLDRLTDAGRGQTLLVVAPDISPEQLLERVADARRRGSTVLALQGVESELADLAHEALVAPADPTTPSLDVIGHLLSAEAGRTETARSRWGRRRGHSRE